MMLTFINFQCDTPEKLTKIELKGPAANCELTFIEDGVRFYSATVLRNLDENKTYYLKVISKGGDFDPNKKYSIYKNILDDYEKRVKHIASSPGYLYNVTKRTGFQYKAGYFKNNVPLDCTYYYHVFNRPTRELWYATNMRVDKTDSTEVDEESIQFGDFTTNWDASKSHPYALKVTFKNVRARVYRNGEKEYAANSVNKEFSKATVLIDPSDYTAFDLLTNNWYYMYGNQRYSFTPYPTEPEF